MIRDDRPFSPRSAWLDARSHAGVPACDVVVFLSFYFLVLAFPHFAAFICLACAGRSCGGFAQAVAG